MAGGQLLLQMSTDAALFTLISGRLSQPFHWGTHDCAMLAFDAVAVVTGQDPAHDLRGAYSTAEEALALLRGMGGLPGLCARRFGAETTLEDARVGDVALLSRHVCSGKSEEHGALGVVWRGCIAAQGERGVVYLPLASGRRFWRAG